MQRVSDQNNVADGLHGDNYTLYHVLKGKWITFELIAFFTFRPFALLIARSGRSTRSTRRILTTLMFCW